MRYNSHIHDISAFPLNPPTVRRALKIRLHNSPRGRVTMIADVLCSQVDASLRMGYLN